MRSGRRNRSGRRRAGDHRRAREGNERTPPPSGADSGADAATTTSPKDAATDAVVDAATGPTADQCLEGYGKTSNSVVVQDKL